MSLDFESGQGDVGQIELDTSAVLRTAFSIPSEITLYQQRKAFLKDLAAVRKCIDNWVPEKFSERENAVKQSMGCLQGMMKTGLKYFPRLEDKWENIIQGGLLDQKTKSFYEAQMAVVRNRCCRAKAFHAEFMKDYNAPSFIKTCDAA